MRFVLGLVLLTACVPGAPSTDAPDTATGPCAEPGAICTIAGRAGQLGFDGDGNGALETMLYFPSGLAWSPEGRLVVDDFNNMRIRELTEDGRLVTIAGVGVHGWAVEGDALLSPLENPIDVAFTADGTLLIAELHTGRVLSVTDQALTILAGSGIEGFAGDGGPALQAAMFSPSGVAVGPDGAIYVSDSDNHCVRVVRDGRIDSVAGDGQPGVDDGLGHARLTHPQRLHVDAARGRLLVADTGNHLVRAIDLATGAVTTIAGSGEAGSDGDGGPATSARLDQPYSAVPLDDGGFLIADLGANVVRRVDADGTIDTIAGTGEKAFSGDGGPAREAALAGPADLLVGEDGAIHVADMFNGVIRRIAP